MWSNQAEVLANKNMTSLKSKITQRKRKNSKSKGSNAQHSNDSNNLETTSTSSSTTVKKQPTSDSFRKPNNVSRNRNNSTGSQKSTSGTVKKNVSQPNSADVEDPKKGLDIQKTTAPETTPKNDVANQLIDEPDNSAIVLREFACTDVPFQTYSITDNIALETSNNIKRYSDSFVISKNSDSSGDNNTLGLGDKSNLRNRSQSTLGVTNVEEPKDSDSSKVIERKSRRFSDIFRYGALRSASSCENIKNLKGSVKTNVNMLQHENECLHEDFPDVQLRRKTMDSVSSVESRKGLSREDIRSGKQTLVDKNVQDTNRKLKNDGSVTNYNDSYLKRVKSKIYKNKVDNQINANTLPTMPNISENTKVNKKNKKKKEKQENNLNKLEKHIKVESAIPQQIELRKSISQFDFRLIRQTSNLEHIRPTSIGIRNSITNLGASELIVSTNNKAVNAEKPILAKSKSSSAINLNLLRTRRNKLLEQAKRNCKIVQDEFDFIAFGAVRSGNAQITIKDRNIQNPSENSNDALEEAIMGETKPTNPVTRTGSDRRPDAVREEASRTQEHVDQNDNEPDSGQQDSTISLPAHTGNKKKTSTNISRSESVKEQSEKRKQRRNISDPLHSSKASGDNIELEDQGLPFQTNSGSSSNSSLSSSRSLDSPSASLDALSGLPLAHPAGTGWDSDLEVEVDPPDWQSSVSEKELLSLDPQERKRQDVINELFHTERSHVRNLRVLECVFRKPLQTTKILKQEEINLIFPNLTELLDLHCQLNTSMKNKRKDSSVIKEIGDILLNMFDGSTGENFQSLAAAFCERQQLALEFIKERRKKDSRFESCLSECEKNNLCRRLPLQGILPTEMQRLSKYPLLLERLIAIEEKRLSSEPEFVQVELCNLKLAHDRSKEILNYVNEAAKIACNRARLEEIQKHLDTSIFEKTEHTILNEFKNLDLTRYNLIQEGTMHLRRPNKQPVALHIVLLEEAVILLQKDAERYLLKFFQAGTTTQQPLAPIIKTSTLLVRANAASKSSLFLVNTSTQNSQMYDLLARDSSERDIWFKHISDAAETYNRREGKSKRSEPTPDIEETEILQDLPSTRDVIERAESIGGDTIQGGEIDNCGSSSENSKRNSDVIDDDKDKRLCQADNEVPETNDAVAIDGLTIKLTADDWPLVQPTEVHVAIPPVHTAEPVFTPIELIRRKDEEIRKALADKEGLVADLLCIPRDDYHLIADIASEETISKSLYDREPSELVLAAVFQAHQLQAAINDSLNVTETEIIMATGGKYASCTSNESLPCKHDQKLPSVPVHRLQQIATNLSSQLTTLLSIVKQRDEERDRLRKELQRTREQLHEKISLHGPPYTDCLNTDSTQPNDLESIEESPTENETN